VEKYVLREQAKEACENLILALDNLVKLADDEDFTSLSKSRYNKLRYDAKELTIRVQDAL